MWAFQLSVCISISSTDTRSAILFERDASRSMAQPAVCDCSPARLPPLPLKPEGCFGALLLLGVVPPSEGKTRLKRGRRVARLAQVIPDVNSIMDQVPLSTFPHVKSSWMCKNLMRTIDRMQVLFIGSGSAFWSSGHVFSHLEKKRGHGIQETERKESQQRNLLGSR